MTFADPGSDAISEQERRAAKSQNKNGQPIKLPSKINAIIADPTSKDRVYAAESAGVARRVDLVVSRCLCLEDVWFVPVAAAIYTIASAFCFLQISILP